MKWMSAITIASLAAAAALPMPYLARMGPPGLLPAGRHRRPTRSFTPFGTGL